MCLCVREQSINFEERKVALSVEMDLDESVAHKFDGWDFPKFHIKDRLLDLQPRSCHKLVIGL